MIDGLPVLDIGAGGLVALVVLAVLTDRLVWHTRLKKVEEELDQWRNMALRSLGVTERLAQSTEVTADVLTKLPDPAAEEGGS